MKETWAFQKAALEGHEEELPQRFQMAFMQGIHQAHTEMLLELRQTLVKIVRLRFPNVVRLAKKQTSSLDDSANIARLNRQNEHRANLRRRCRLPTRSRRRRGRRRLREM